MWLSASMQLQPVYSFPAARSGLAANRRVSHAKRALASAGALFSARSRIFSVLRNRGAGAAFRQDQVSLGAFWKGVEMANRIYGGSEGMTAAVVAVLIIGLALLFAIGVLGVGMYTP
jgi:hypothetical protein